MNTKVPDTYKDVYRRAQEGSRKAAIRVMCLECCGWMPSEVKLCTAPDCPLFRFREKG